VYISAFCANPDQLAREILPMPTSWLDLLDPIYRERIILPDPQYSGTGYMTIVGLIQLFINQDPRGEALREWAATQRLEGEAAAWAYLDALHENVLRYSISDQTPCLDAASGEVPIGIAYGAVAIDEARRGSPVIAVFPKEGSGWDIESVALVKKTTIKPAARIFIDWALSESAMRAYHHYYPIVANGTEGEPLIGYISDPIQQMLPNRLVWSSANYDRIVTQWLNRYESKAEAGSIERIPSGAQATPVNTPAP
jgi:iron(III) transport system substrate-binding protein